MAMNMASSMFDSAASATDAKGQKRYGFQVADAKEESIRRSTSQALGEQRAAAAQSGFDPSSGSIVKLQQQSAGEAELDALTARYEGQLNAWKMDESIQRARDKMNFVINPIGTQLGGKASAILTGPIGSLGYSGGRYFSRKMTGG